jgi:hypothetical protein
MIGDAPRRPTPLFSGTSFATMALFSGTSPFSNVDTAVAEMRAARNMNIMMVKDFMLSDG